MYKSKKCIYKKKCCSNCNNVLNNNSTLEKLEENVDNMLAMFQFGFK